MYQIYFYKDKRGEEPVLDYLKELSQQKGKDSRIRLNKISDYLNILQEVGTVAGLPVLRHLEGEIWELRPLRDRILFVTWFDGSFVLLHHFMKKSQKTPRREIEQAKRELNDLRKRGLENGE